MRKRTTIAFGTALLGAVWAAVALSAPTAYTTPTLKVARPGLRRP